MSFFTPADAAYIKGSIKKIAVSIAASCYAERDGIAHEDYDREANEEQARLEAFIDGCTLEKGKA